jgi:hypothetical protein
MNDEERQRVRKLALEMTQKYADRGLIIESGWVGLTIIWGLENAPVVQKMEMRKAFFAGAQHLFTCIMNVLEPGAEPTDKDLKVMDGVFKELEDFKNQMLAQGDQ